MGSAARHRQRWKNSGGMNKLSRLVIVGASGHGKVIADIAKLNGYDDIVFLDDDEAVTECAGYPVIGCSCDFSKVVSIPRLVSSAVLSIVLSRVML